MDNKTVLITGASSGIGEALAYKFAKNKYSLILTYNKNKEGADKVKTKCLEYACPSVKVFLLDLASEESILRFSSEINNKINILINNAANVDKGFLDKVSWQDIDRQISTNLNGVIKLTKELLPKITETIVNVSSSLGIKGKENHSIYSATKFGIRGFSKSLAMERKDLRILIANPSAVGVTRNNYRGMNVNKAAEIIFDMVIGKIKIKSGGDLMVRDYKYGKNMKLILIVARKIRSILKF